MVVTMFKKIFDHKKTIENIRRNPKGFAVEVFRLFIIYFIVYHFFILVGVFEVAGVDYSLSGIIFQSIFLSIAVALLTF